MAAGGDGVDRVDQMNEYTVINDEIEVTHKEIRLTGVCQPILVQLLLPRTQRTSLAPVVRGLFMASSVPPSC